MVINLSSFLMCRLPLEPAGKHFTTMRLDDIYAGGVINLGLGVIPLWQAFGKL